MKGIIACILLGCCCTMVSHAQRKVTILDHKDKIRIQRMEILNSAERETNISISPDGKYLFFCSFRGGQFWSRQYMYFKSRPVWDGDLWYSEKLNGEWQKPKPLQYGVNTESGEDEPHVSADGMTVYYQSWLPKNMWRYTGGPYYRTERKGKYWGRPEGLGGGITDFFLDPDFNATDGMTISPDEKTFIVAAGEDYEMDANMNLYMSRKGPDGWSTCRKLAISTPGNERSVFMSGDGKTLYFASDGYKGYGGMDIFKTTIREDGTYGPIINIGKPFNTPDDDYGFILTQNGEEAYFLRNGNIYFADLKEADEAIKPGVEIPETEVQLSISGLVKSRNNWESLPAQVVVIDKATGLPIKRVNTEATGKYHLQVANKAGNYSVIASCEGYEKATRNVSTQANESSFSYQVNFLLNPVEEAGVPDPEPEPIVVEKTPEPEPVPKEPEPEVKEKEEEVKALPEPEPRDRYDFKDVANNHLVLLLDVSASMNTAERLPLLKESLSKLLTYLREQDRISIVVYSGDVNTVLESASAKEGERIISLIESLESGGTTMGQSGLLAAYKVASRNFINGGNNRIIMATDGEFSVKPLFPLAEGNAKRNINLSIFSFQDKNPELRELARKGQGYFTRITAENVEKALLREATAVRKKS